MKVFFTQLILMVTFAGTVFSHGILAGSSQEKGLGLYAEYDDGEPAAYAEVEIFFDKATLPFQTGRTDKNGRFLFLPDQEGPWQAVINDGMGHKAVVRVSYSRTLAGLNKPDAEPPVPDTIIKPGKTLFNILVGVGVILNLCFMGNYLFRRSDKKRQAP